MKFRSALAGFLLLCSACPGGTIHSNDPDGSVPGGDAAPDGAPGPDAALPPSGLVDVLTQHNDIARTGANLAETKLDVAKVAGPSFGKVFARDVDDQIYAQPLIVSGLSMPGAGLRNVVFVATVGDTVYAYDADDPAATTPLWKQSLLLAGERPVRNTDMFGACNGNYTDFSGNIGVVGTPVIDRVTSTLYVVSRSRMVGGQFVQRLHALSILDGSERAGSPVVIQASVPGNGDGAHNGVLKFDPLRENQRAAMLLLDGVLYMTWAGHCDWGPYHGWIMGYDATTLAQVVVHNTTPEGSGGGIWQAGQGMSSDGTFLYAITGNGTIGDDTSTGSPVNRGQTIMKLKRSGSALHIESWFTPYNYYALEQGDLDLGSAGLLLIPGTNLGVSGGKGGWLYVVDRDNMGGLTQNQNADDNVVQTFVLNEPYHLHGSPVYWKGPSGGRVYAWAEEDFLKAFPVLPAASAQPGQKVLDVDNLEKSLVQAPHQLPGGSYAMPGAMMSISADGSKAGTGIIWASMPSSGSANNEVRPGVLRAFDASDVTHELWNSNTNMDADDCGSFAKFSYPTIANGKVYLASFAHQLCVYGLGQ